MCVQILFGFLSGFSGSSLFDTFSLTAYNIAFTNLPALLTALERDVEPSSAMSVPGNLE